MEGKGDRTWLKIGPLSSPVGDFLYDTIRYTREKFNVDSKAECDQLNLTHIARKIYKKLKQTNASMRT